jgi:hypothetical protein
MIMTGSKIEELPPLLFNIPIDGFYGYVMIMYRAGKPGHNRGVIYI